MSLGEYYSEDLRRIWSRVVFRDRKHNTLNSRQNQDNDQTYRGIEIVVIRLLGLLNKRKKINQFIYIDFIFY
jgi:hypothetical protein